MRRATGGAVRVGPIRLLLPARDDSDQIGISEAAGTGSEHIVIGLLMPYPERAAQWVADELVTTSA